MAVNKKLPKSRLMIEYDTRIEGEAKKKELPYRILVVGDLSKGKSKDAQMEFEDRPLRVVKNGLDSTLRDMKISSKMNVPNSINPSKSTMLDIDYKLTCIADFQPDRIAKKVPELNALLELKSMLSSFEKDIDNNRTLKKAIDRIFSNKESLEALKKQMPKLQSYHWSKPKTAALEGDLLVKENNDQKSSHQGEHNG